MEPSLRIGRVDVELSGVSLDIREGDLRRLLHHVAELPGKSQAGFSIHGGGLDKENITTGSGDRQSSGYTRNVGAIGRFVLPNLGLAEVIPDVGLIDQDRRGLRLLGDLALRHSGGNLASQLAQFPLEVSDAGFSRVAVDDRRHCTIGDLELLRLQTGVANLARQKMICCNLYLLVVGVPVDTDHLGPVEQRAGNGLDHVGGGDEQHLGKVKVHFEIVVPECVVLSGVENLEQRR